MKKALSLVLAVTMAMMTFILTGCISIQSTVKFNADNTCDVICTVAVLSDMLLDEETGEKSELFSEEELESFAARGLEYEKYGLEGYTGYTFRAKEKITGETNVITAGAFGSDLSFYLEGDKVIFCGPTSIDLSDEDTAKSLAKIRSLHGYGIITIEFPFAPLETNASSVSKDGKSLTWDIFKDPAAYAVFALEDFTKARMTTDYMTVNPFEDVEFGTYYHKAVLWAYKNGITTGTTATKFAPEATCTRGQVVTFLWRALGEPEPATTENPFTDVSETDYFYKAVLWAVGNGITSGTSATKFSPATTCSNAHILTFLWRFFGEPDKISAGEWYTDAVNWVGTFGLLDGIYEDEFVPTADCPRSDVVTFLSRTFTSSPADFSYIDLMMGMMGEIPYGPLYGEVEPKETLLIINGEEIHTDEIVFFNKGKSEHVQFPLLLVLEGLECEVERDENAAHIKANGVDYTLDFEKEKLYKGSASYDNLLLLPPGAFGYKCIFTDSDVIIDDDIFLSVKTFMDLSVIMRFDSEQRTVTVTSR